MRATPQALPPEIYYPMDVVASRLAESLEAFPSDAGHAHAIDAIVDIARTFAYESNQENRAALAEAFNAYGLPFCLLDVQGECDAN